MAQKKEQIINLEILKSGVVDFEIKSLQEFGLKKISGNQVAYDLDMNVKVDEEKKLIAVFSDLYAYHKEDLKKKKNRRDFYKLSSINEFQVPNFSKLLNEKGEFQPPDEFVRKIMNISIGGLRGMLAILLTSSDYEEIVLPLFDLSKLNQD